MQKNQGQAGLAGHNPNSGLTQYSAQLPLLTVGLTQYSAQLPLLTVKTLQLFSSIMHHCKASPVHPFNINQAQPALV